MGAIKTKVTTESVTDFLDAVPDEQKRKDSYILLDLFKKLTGEKPKLWSNAIVGFGQYHYKSERSSQEGDWMLTGFSPRKAALTLYGMHGVDEKMMKSLGKCKKGSGCLYINKLADIDQTVLKKIITTAYETMKKTYTA